MRSRAFLLAAALFLALGEAGRAEALPIVPPAADRVAAAQVLLDALPIVESVMARFLPNAVRAEVVQAMLAAARSSHPAAEVDAIGHGIQSRTEQRIDEVLPAILPLAKADMATDYAYQFTVAQLDVATAYFSSLNGRPFAIRMVAQDPAIRGPLNRRLLQRIGPELETMVVDAREAERVRLMVNAGRRR